VAIVELLVKLQIIDERQHDAVMSRGRSSSGGVLVQQVAEMGYATEGTVARAISVELGLPRIDIGMTPPEPAALALLDARMCAAHFVLPVALRENGELLWLAMADPTDQEAIGLIRRKTQKRVRPAVAGPSEILRAVRTLYAAPNAGSNVSEAVGDVQLSPIEISSADDNERFEVVGVSEVNTDGSPLSRIAAQLGVPVPAQVASKTGKIKPPPIAEDYEIPLDDSPSEVTSSGGMPMGMIAPKTDPKLKRQPLPPPLPASFEELFAPPPHPGDAAVNELSVDDLKMIEAIRGSIEKGALILRSLAELCVDKRLFTREEMRKRNQK
jgi:hypothetical protein